MFLRPTSLNPNQTDDPIQQPPVRPVLNNPAPAVNDDTTPPNTIQPPPSTVVTLTQPAVNLAAQPTINIAPDEQQRLDELVANLQNVIHTVSDRLNRNFDTTEFNANIPFQQRIDFMATSNNTSPFVQVQQFAAIIERLTLQGLHLIDQQKDQN